MDEPEYISVAAAREQLGLSPKEMSTLTTSGALRVCVDPSHESISRVASADVAAAVAHLVRYRQAEKMRLFHFALCDGDDQHIEPTRTQFFTLSEADLMTLLLASVSYFDAERNLSFSVVDALDHFGASISVAEKMCGKLQRGSAQGRAIPEIIMEIYEQQPSQQVRQAVCRYFSLEAQA